MPLRKRKPETEAVMPVESSREHTAFEEMERWFDEAVRSPFSLFRRPFLPARWMADEITPSVDLFEEGDDLVVKAELPGMDKKDLNVSLHDDVLTISGEKKKEEKVKEKNYYRVERSSGSFSRSFRLPAEVKSDKVTATFKNGVLELRLPKTEEAKKKEIKIQVQ